jgi:hypothetical protein
MGLILYWAAEDVDEHSVKVGFPASFDFVWADVVVRVGVVCRGGRHFRHWITPSNFRLGVVPLP